jgi:hypothetical protein
MWQTHVLKTRLVWIAGLAILVILLSGCNTQDQSANSDDQKPPLIQSSSTPVFQVTGKVTDESGNPIAEAGVTVTKGSAGVPDLLVLTNENGEYIWDLPAGEFTLTARQDNYLDISKDITVKEGEKLELNFQLKKKP